MASNQTPLWSSVLFKEAIDLMVAVWPTLPNADREKLVDRIIAGPPLPDEEPEDPGEREHRQRWFDRRIFERLALIERLRSPPLPPAGEEALASLRRSYPQWRIEEGVRAHFSTWIESHVGMETDRSPEELEALKGPALVEALRAVGQDREGRLSIWGQLVRRRPARGIALLPQLSDEPAPGDEDIWRDTLYGLRDSMGRPAIARRVVDLLILAPDAIVSSPRLLSPTSDALQTASKQQPLPISEDRFLRLWERLVDACLAGEVEPDPEDHDWVGRAINRPLGRLTEALLNVMFRRGLKAGEGIPTTFRQHLDQLTAEEPHVLRLARTILASRLLYLFAVDPVWVRTRILPHFDWQHSEEDAAALWRAYGWGARINTELWIELAPFFYDAFTPARRERLGRTSETLASLLMVAGVEFPDSTVPTDRSRRAIRAMDARDREKAVSWIRNYLARAGTGDEDAPIGAEQPRRADRMWAERVLPWIRRAWPRDANLVTPGTSEQFALLAITTHDEFPAAVGFLLPYINGSENWGPVVHNILRSEHPTDHPEAVLRLLGKLVVLDGTLFTNNLRMVLDQVAAADPLLRQDVVYRSLDTALRAVGR